jgi:hypothetical protein
MKLAVTTFLLVDGVMQGPGGRKRTAAMGSLGAAGWSRTLTRTPAG